MLSAADFPSTDFADLQRRVHNAMMRTRRSVRLARTLAASSDLTGVATEMDALDQDTITLAECESIISRFIAEQGRGRAHLRVVS